MTTIRVLMLFPVAERTQPMLYPHAPLRACASVGAVHRAVWFQLTRIPYLGIPFERRYPQPVCIRYEED